MEKFPNRIPSLDGLRAVSIVLVIVGHLFHVLGYGYAGNLGNLGVRVFFVISGFLITGLLIKEIDKTSKIDLLKFYFRRTLRIFPPFYFYLLIIFTAALLGFIVEPLKSFLFAATYTTNYLNPSGWYLGHTWSLSVEEQFYLLFPGVLLLAGKRGTKILLCLLVLASPLIRLLTYQIFGSEPIWVSKGFQANMDALAVGCLLTLFYARLHQNALYRKLLKSKFILLCPLIVLFFNIQYEHPHVFYGVSITAINLLVAFCVDWAVTNHESAAGKLLNSAPLVTLGMMSYSIYLWQQPFFNPENASFLTRTPFNFLGLAIMTLISYFWVEKYSLKLRQRLEAKIFRKTFPPNVKSVGEYQISAN